MTVPPQHAQAPDGLDYSFSRPTSTATLKALGIRVVMRYLSPPPNAKNLTASEAAGLLAGGIGIVLNWESAAGRPLLGAAAGSVDGATAATLAETLPAPHGLTIYFSCDRDIDIHNTAQMSAILAYYLAVRAALAGRYKVGVYGEADLIDYLVTNGAVDGEWQTYAWSGGRLSANADLYQYLNGQTLAGANVDFDRIIHADKLGAWWPDGLAPAGSGALEDDDMPTIDDVEQACVRAVNAALLPTMQEMYLGPSTDLSQAAYQAGNGLALWTAYKANLGSPAAQTAYQNGYNAWYASMAAAAARTNIKSLGVTVGRLSDALGGVLQAIAALSTQVDALDANSGTAATLAGVQQAAHDGASEAIDAASLTVNFGKVAA